MRNSTADDYDVVTGTEEHRRHDGATHVGLLLASTAVFGLGAALAMLWTGGTFLGAFLAYMVGGWFGLGVAAITIFWRSARP